MAIPVQCSTLLGLLFFSCLHHCCTSTCREGERKALLQFKDSLDVYGGLLSSWVGHDCCSWWGVVCSNRTGHVIQLSVRSPDYGHINADKIDPSLLALRELQHLDLSRCNFNGAQIPKFVGSFEKLRYLDLSFTNIAGTVPQELGNLSSLHYLNLAHSGGMFWVDDRRLEIEDGSWLSNLSSLQYLNLSSVEIKNPSPALQSLSMLPFLLDLRLAASLGRSVPYALHPGANFSSLLVLDLSSNMLNTAWPSWWFEIGSLRHLYLSDNDVNHVPKRMTNLTSLQILDLSYNEHLDVDSLSWALSKLTQLKTLGLSSIYLKGQFPVWLGNLKSLEILDLSYNQLDGKLSPGLGRLSSRLVKLYLSGNSFDDVLTEEHFRNFPNLRLIRLIDTPLAIDIAPEWNPPPITDLILVNCKVGPAFPAWLKKLENVSTLVLSNVSISDAAPDWLWNFSSNISAIILSNNMIKGRLPTSISHLSNLQSLDLSNNMIKGRLPTSISHLSNLQWLDLSNNQLEGHFPSCICKLKELVTLQLSLNRLSGEIPNCWGSHNVLRDIDLSNNDLQGTIPASIFSGSSLQALNLEGNNLSGGIPLAIQSCTELRILNLGSNKFNGSVPTWLGGVLTSLEILILRSNMLVGNIPKELGKLFSLQVIDLSQNMLSGSMPQSIANFSAMKHDYLNAIAYYEVLEHRVDINMKGRVIEYSTEISHLPTTIDLSSNNLSGEIPEALMTLVGLQNLNLSRNHLTGTIPRTIMRLKYLESLDLSFNSLTGEIPSSMINLNFLSIMNFSFNNLSGRIPKGGQFDCHPDPSIYLGNDHLCGFPLDSACEGNVTNMPSQSNNKGEDEDVWFYVSIAAGFIIGFWTLIGALLLNRNQRIAYYQSIDRGYDNLYVFVKVNLAKIRRI